MDDEIKRLLNELKSLASDDLREYSKAFMLLNNIDDAAMLTFSIDKYECKLPLIHVEVIAMFNEFLQNAIEYYKVETE